MKKLTFAAIYLVSLILSVASLAFAYEDISPQEVKQKLDAGEDIFIVDVRQPEEYAQGYVPKALLIPLGEIEQRLDEIPRNLPVIVVCKSGWRSAQASQILDDNGFDNIHNMVGGTLAWKDMPSYLYVTPQDLRDQLADVNKLILDVRTVEEYSAAHIEIAISIPFDQLDQRLDEIPQDKEIVVVATDDDQGVETAEKLIESGYTEVKNMAGGMQNWDFETAVFASGKMITTFGALKTALID